MSETQLFFIFWTDTWNQISNSRSKSVISVEVRTYQLPKCQLPSEVLPTGNGYLENWSVHHS